MNVFLQCNQLSVLSDISDHMNLDPECDASPEMKSEERDFVHHFYHYSLSFAIRISMAPPQKRGGFSRGGGGGSNTRFTGKRGGPSRGRGRGGGVAYGIDRPAPQREDDGTAAAEKFEEVRVWDEIDTKLGFERFESNRASGEEKIGWMVNMHQVGQVVQEAYLLSCGID
jgi:hypothetical protein